MLIYEKNVLGKDGKPFRLRKFRTMGFDAEAKKEEFSRTNGLDETGHVTDDPRIIPVYGHLMRALHFDELPQLENVFRGEMVWLGLRPRSEAEWSFYPEDVQRKALYFKPGIFSPVYAETNLDSFEDKVEVEREYLERRVAEENIHEGLLRKIIWGLATHHIPKALGVSWKGVDDMLR